MSKLSIVIAILLLAATSNLVSDNPNDTNITQISMNLQEIEDCKKAESKMDSVYQLIVEVYSDDKLFLEKLETSQKLWEKSSEANFYMMYPVTEDAGFEYGSVFPMCACSFREAQVTKRTEFLEEWLVGTPEGDVCAGSLKKPWEIKASLKERRSK